MEKTVEAIILAGGKGTRLAPLTEDTPKPLLKVMGKTVLETVFDKLKECGIRKTHVTTMYLPWQIESLGARHGELSVNYVREQTPLGTAGAVKNAYDGNSDTVIVLSGDGIFDFDLKSAINYHFEKNADVTIVTYNTENPLEYGVVLYGSDGKITRFAEKPPWAQVVSGTVNTGIYILNRKIIDRIPANTEYDFAKHLFPLLLAQNYMLYAYEAKGVWHDIGNLDAYFTANCSAIDGEIAGLKNQGLSQKELEDKQIEAEMPVYVSKSAVMGRNVKLGAYTFIGDNAVISDGCDIACSIISDGAVLGMGCGIYGTLIGRNAKLGENCVTSEGCAIGANTVADDSVILPKYSLIHSGTRITCSDYMCSRSGKKDRALFGEDGICCNSDKASPEFIMHIGYSAALTVCAKKSPGSTRIGVMSDGNAYSNRICSIILNGIQSAGVRSIDYSCGFESMARFAALEFIADIIIYVSRDSRGNITAKLFDEYGLDVSGAFEREFSNNFYTHSEYTSPDRFYEPDHFNDMWTLYYSRVVSECKALLSDNPLEGFVCSFKDNGDIKAYSPAYTALYAINELGGRIRRNPKDAPFVFEIDDRGMDVKCKYSAGKLDRHHMRAVILNNAVSSEKSPVYLSSSMPDVFKSIAKTKGINYREYTLTSERDKTTFNKKNMHRSLWLNDGIFTILYFAIAVKKLGIDAKNITKNLPDFEIYSRTFEGNPNRAGVMQRLSKLSAQISTNPKNDSTEREGIRLFLSNGSVTIIPGKISGFKIISEAQSMEAAQELCDKAEEYLKP